MLLNMFADILKPISRKYKKRKKINLKKAQVFWQ